MAPTLVCRCIRPLSKQTERFAMCQFLPLNSSFSVSSLFALFAYYLCRAAALDCRIVCQSASQLVSQLVSVMSESVSQVSWLSDVLFWDERLRRPLPVMCQVLSSQTDANDSGMRWNSVTSRYPPALSCCSASPLTNVD